MTQTAQAYPSISVYKELNYLQLRLIDILHVTAYVIMVMPTAWQKHGYCYDWTVAMAVWLYHIRLCSN